MQLKSKSQIKHLLQFKIVPPLAMQSTYWRTFIGNGGRQDIKFLLKKLLCKF